MIESIPTEIVRAAEENRLIVSPIPIGQPVFVVEKCTCSPLYAKRCRRNPAPQRKAICCEPLGEDRNGVHCAKVYVRPFDYAMHSRKLGKTVFTRKLDALLAVKNAAEKQYE